MRLQRGLFLSLILLTLIFVSAPAFAATKPAITHGVTQTYRFLICINALFFAGIMTAMSVYIFKNRKRGMDMIWTMLPAVMLIIIVGLGWVNFSNSHQGESFYAVKFSQ